MRILESRPALIFLGAVIFIFFWSVLGFWGKMRDTTENKRIALDKVAELRESKEKLTEDIEKLETEQGVEESIREKFGLVREGEGVIVVVDEENEEDATAEEEEGGFFSFFTNLFR